MWCVTAAIQWEQLGVGGILAVAFLVLSVLCVRYAIPAVVNSIDKNIAGINATYSASIESLRAAVRTILDDNQAQRVACDKEISAIREEMSLQRDHDRQMREAMLSRLQEQGLRIEQLIQLVAKLTGPMGS